MSGLAWRDGTVWDRDVDELTTSVGRYLASARAPEGPYTRLLSDHFVEGMTFAGMDGVEAAGRFLADVERRLTARLARCDGMFMLQGLRRLSRRLWIIDHYDPAAFQTRRLAELAVHKWARWRRVRTNPDHKVFRWDEADARDIAYTLSLAEAYEAGAAIRRRLAKGQTLKVTDPAVPDVVANNVDSERVGRLIALLDRRVWPPRTRSRSSDRCPRPTRWTARSCSRRCGGRSPT